MRKFLLAAVGAMALAGGTTAANAGPVVSSPTGVLPPALTPPASGLYGSNLTAGPGTFDDTFTFTILGAPAMFDTQVTTQAGPGGTQNINFTQLALDGVLTTVSGGMGSGGYFVKTSSDGNPETWAIPNTSPVYLTTGTHTLEFWGNLIGPTGSYSGTLNVNQAVPEAKTWAMMLLGFAGVGFAIRRRRKPVLAQLA